MTFTWNVPGGTAEPALVVRADAPPGDVARAALSLLDSVLDQVAEALDGPEYGDLRLEVDGDDLVLVIEQEGAWVAAVEAGRGALAALGVTRVTWASVLHHEFEVSPASAGGAP